MLATIESTHKSLVLLLQTKLKLGGMEGVPTPGQSCPPRTFNKTFEHNLGRQPISREANSRNYSITIIGRNNHK